MKKLLISLFALVAALASCSKSAVVEVPFENIPISFSPYNGRTPEVKSTSFEADSLDSFKFHALAFLNEASTYLDKTVWREEIEGTKTWKYDGVSYWPGTATLEFLAYGLNTNYNANDVDDNIVTLAQNKRSIAVAVPDVVKNQRDLLVATPAKESFTTSGGTVGLNFAHMFSRIQFSLKTTDGNNIAVAVEDINISGNFYKTGNVDLTYRETTPATETEPAVVVKPSIDVTDVTAEATTYNYIVNGTESYTGIGSNEGDPIYDNSMMWTKNTGNDSDSENDDEYVANAEGDADAAAWNKANRFMMIIPVEGATHQAELNVKYFLPFAGTFDADSDPTTPEVEPIDLSGVNFEAGKSYNFVLEISTNSIKFTVEITDWVDGTIPAEKQVIKLN